VNDLFFSVKISEAAKRNGLALEFVKDSGEVLAKAKEAKPSLIVFDLNFESVDPLDLITKLKASAETKSVSLLGYLSHLQSELKVQAQDAGCDMVLARSAFSQNMLMIFKRHAGIG
jgi:PleD family two-component response regulator